MLNYQISIFFDEKAGCFIAKLDQLNLQGCGDSSNEALRHLLNHWKDEMETPRIKKELK